jgi:hypothetical protein
VAHEATPPAAAPALVLPVLIFGIVEVRRLRRELNSLEDFLGQAAIREPGKQAPLPRVSRLLDAIATDNKLQLLQTGDRQKLAIFLATVEQKAPSIHISFAIDPSSAFTAKLVTWLRSSIHPYTLLEVGLQPTIAAGCVVRTPNKVFDFSLRKKFADSRALLLASLEAATAAPVREPVSQETAAPAGAAS